MDTTRTFASALDLAVADAAAEIVDLRRDLQIAKGTITAQDGTIAAMASDLEVAHNICRSLLAQLNASGYHGFPDQLGREAITDAAARGDGLAKPWPADTPIDPKTVGDLIDWDLGGDRGEA